ncbi:hypothetical protein EniLVp02_0105 [Vibrio phage EniLVp02]
MTQFVDWFLKGCRVSQLEILGSMGLNTDQLGFVSPVDSTSNVKLPSALRDICRELRNSLNTSTTWQRNASPWSNNVIYSRSVGDALMRERIIITRDDEDDRLSLITYVPAANEGIPPRDCGRFHVPRRLDPLWYPLIERHTEQVTHSCNVLTYQGNGVYELRRRLSSDGMTLSGKVDTNKYIWVERYQCHGHRITVRILTTVDVDGVEYPQSIWEMNNVRPTNWQSIPDYKDKPTIDMYSFFDRTCIISDQLNYRADTGITESVDWTQICQNHMSHNWFIERLLTISSQFVPYRRELPNSDVGVLPSILTPTCSYVVRNQPEQVAPIVSDLAFGIPNPAVETNEKTGMIVQLDRSRNLATLVCMDGNAVVGKLANIAPCGRRRVDLVNNLVHIVKTGASDFTRKRFELPYFYRRRVRNVVKSIVSQLKVDNT